MSKTVKQNLSSGQKIAIHRHYTEGYIRLIEDGKGIKHGKRCKPRKRGFDGTLRSFMSNRLREIQILGR